MKATGESDDIVVDTFLKELALFLSKAYYSQEKSFNENPN